MKFMIRKSKERYSWHVRASRQLLATMALTLGLLGGSAVVPDVANAAAPGIRPEIDQRLVHLAIHLTGASP